MPHRISERRQLDLTAPAPRPTAVAPVYAVPDFSRNVDPQSALPTFGAVLWKGKYRVAAAAVCGLLLGAAAAYLTKPVYRARTSLLLEGFNEQAMGSVTPVSPLAASPGDYLQNEVKVLESDTLANRLARQLGSTLLERPGAPQLDLTPEQLMHRLEKAITVRTGIQSQVMEVYFDAPTADLAAKGANAVTGEFINLNREARNQLVQDTTEWLNKQAAELKGKLDNLNRQLEGFTASSGLILAGPQGTPVEDRARQLQDALTRAQADRAAKQAQYESATSGQGDVSLDSSGPIQQYETDLEKLKTQVADLKTIYQPDNYRVTRLQAQIATTEAAIRNERAAQRERLKNQYLAAQSLERMLSSSLGTQLAKVQQQTQRQLQYNALKNDVDTTQKLYDSVLERAKDAGAESSLRVTNIRVIDAAVPPPLPYSPNLPLDLAFGLAAGALGGVALVMLGTRSGKVRRPGELTSLCVPELGAVPSASKELAASRKGLIARDALPVDTESSLLWESFRAVLISILFRADGKCRPGAEGDGRVLVVSSLDMMEGKTTIVTNLGMASAQHQRDVLLVDADLRRPRLHERFALPNETGLVDILQRSAERGLPADFDPETYAQKTHIPHLSVMTAGPADKGSANLLFTPDLDLVLERLARHYDLIFIDTPPLAMYPEARVMGRVSDGVVMVVRSNTRSREELQTVYQKLVDDRIPVLGTILNDWKIDRGQARAYSKYYSHYQRGK